MNGRLGLNVNRDAWPAAPVLHERAAAGFAWAQVHSPPITTLLDRRHALHHARALSAVFASTDAHLIVHGPDALSLGWLEHDKAFEALLEHAAEAGAEIVVYHGRNFAPDEARSDAEELSLRRLARMAEELRLTIAVENLSPVWPGPRHVSHDPLAVRDLVRAVASPAVGMLLDVGHAHITSAIADDDLAAVTAAVASEVVLFHVHDNLGARRHDLQAPGVDPLKLDLHLPPGAGNLPWDRLAPLLRHHTAPLMLEVERSHVADVATLAEVTRGLLHRGTALAA